MEDQEEEGVEVVLAKATELRFKINNCIQKAPGAEKDTTSTTLLNPPQNPTSLCQQQHHDDDDDDDGDDDDDDDDDGDTEERLLNIRDAIESLESHLVNLQNLQQQQRYEKQVVLKEIDDCRKMLLEKLKGYKGKELEVLQEASVFAGETVKRNDSDLLLPPYPSRPPRSLVLDSSCYVSQLQKAQGAPTCGRAKGETEESARDCEARGKGLGSFILSAARTVLPLVGAIYLVSLSSGIAAKSRDGIPNRVLQLFQQPRSEERRTSIVCPPGKMLVTEGGEARCLVKERIEIPFDSDVAKPGINYGCG